MKKFISFPKISDLKSVVRDIIHSARYTGLDENNQPIYNHDPLPTLTFTGTVKLHGTNASVCYNNESGFWVQSRSKIITPTKDNAGFAFVAESKKDAFMTIINQIAEANNVDLDEFTIAVFGEWAGCFTYSTPILLSDGTKMPIGKIVNNQLDVEVMTYNKYTGCIESKKVVGWHKNGSTDDWLNISVKRRKRGGKTTSIKCTPNHRIFTDCNGLVVEKCASELNVGDKLWVGCNRLQYTLKEFLKGTILGDGSFDSKRSITISHSDDDQPYYNAFIEKILSGMSTSNDSISGYGSNKRGNKEIRMSPTGTNAFLYHIAPYVIDAFNYKLPEYLHDIPKIDWWNDIIGEYDNSILSTEIESIDSCSFDDEYKKERYDITVADNSNYFANNILVHNSGIQKGVAITELEKAFYIFGIKIAKPQDPEFNNYWVDSIKYSNEENSIFNVDMFKTYSVDIDFNNPQLAVNYMIELVNEVESECPISKERGVSGIGEGIVWRTDFKGSTYRFKTKGEKHSVTKVKKLVQVDSEKLQSVADFVAFAVTQNRVDQGIKEICGDEQPQKSQTGPFLKWIVNDILDEEQSTLVDNGLEPKDVTKSLSTTARNMFFRACDEW